VRAIGVVWEWRWERGVEKYEEGREEDDELWDKVLEFAINMIFLECKQRK
jgi:hypothetical protein